MVNLDWLLDSAQNRQLEPESSYALDNPKSLSGTGNAKSKTRSAAARSNTSVMKPDDKTDNTTKPSSKGRKRARQNAAAVDDDIAHDDAAENSEPATKRFKDGQKSKSASLSIPVDEGCHLSGKRPMFTSISAELTSQHRYSPGIY